MRGKALFKASTAVQTRITPAYAGKSDGLLLTKVEAEDHPRLCGEKQFLPQSRFG